MRPLSVAKVTNKGYVILVENIWLGIEHAQELAFLLGQRYDHIAILDGKGVVQQFSII